MATLRLLERLRYLENPPERKPDELSPEIESIFHHVKYVLGTHKGAVPISDEYGMPDLFFSRGINFKESSRRMRDSISEVITRFETRLRNVKVEALSTRDDLLKQKFRINAVFARNVQESIDFIVEISSEANITIMLERD